MNDVIDVIPLGLPDGSRVVSMRNVRNEFIAFLADIPGEGIQCYVLDKDNKVHKVVYE